MSSKFSPPEVNRNLTFYYSFIWLVPRRGSPSVRDRSLFVLAEETLQKSEKSRTRHTLAPMDNERIRAICLALPHVTETVNWGHHLVTGPATATSAARCSR
jgi:hypothetical protein